jgi:hypothetical protein
MRDPSKPKNRAAVSLGKRRQQGLTPEQRRELGRKGAEIRWKRAKQKRAS